jgi:hypothetical protein
MTLHPKAAGAAFFAALGTVVVGVLQSIKGVHLQPTLDAAIPALLSSFGAWVMPSPATTAPVAPVVPVTGDTAPATVIQ